MFYFWNLSLCCVAWDLSNLCEEDYFNWRTIRIFLANLKYTFKLYVFLLFLIVSLTFCLSAVCRLAFKKVFYEIGRKNTKRLSQIRMQTQKHIRKALPVLYDFKFQLSDRIFNVVWSIIHFNSWIEASDCVCLERHEVTHCSRACYVLF